VLSDALNPLNFKSKTCVNSDCDFLFYQPAPWPLGSVGVDHVQVSLHVETLMVSLVDANRHETPLARKVTVAVQDAVRANLGGEINFEKEKVAHSCFFGPGTPPCSSPNSRMNNSNPNDRCVRTILPAAVTGRGRQQPTKQHEKGPATSEVTGPN